ncbi:MAG: hypothetical protein K8F30_10870 [Taibaiella sp.]|nr:hypothetical protein [Taibaiella sp.]
MYRVVDELKLKTKGVIKVFCVGSVIRLSEASAGVLVQQGKIEPVSEPVKTEDVYELLFDKVCGELAKKYVAGALAFAQKNKPELIHDSLEAENRINDFWGNDFPAFEKAVTDWKSFCLSMIDLHRNAQKYLCTCGNPGERLMLCTQTQYKARWYCLKCRPYQNT